MTTLPSGFDDYLSINDHDTQSPPLVAVYSDDDKPELHAAATRESMARMFREAPVQPTFLAISPRKPGIVARAKAWLNRHDLVAFLVVAYVGGMLMWVWISAMTN